MASKSSAYTVKVAGPGVTLDRPISEDVANQIINLVMTGTTGQQSAGGGAGAGSAGGAGLGSAGGSAPPGQGQLAGVIIKQFVAQKRPENVYQRVACLAYYLTHALNTPHFKTKEISKANTDAAAGQFTNPSARVNDATSKYGYLSAVRGGQKQITHFGEQVVEALPNYEQVKQLHTENRSHGRKRSARKKKPR